MNIFNRKSSILKSWIMSYIIILFVVALINSIVFGSANNIVSQLIDEANRAMLKQMQKSLDDRLAEARKVGFQISLNKNLEYFGDYDQTTANFERIQKINNEFSTYVVANDFIDDFYVYFRDNDIVLKPDGVSSKKYVYDIKHYNNQFSYAEWLRIMDSMQDDKFIPLPHQNLGNQIVFLKSLPIGSNPFGMAAVIMSQSKLLELIKNTQWVDSGIIFVIDKNNNIITSTKPLNNLRLTYNDIPDTDNGYGVFKTLIEGKQNSVLYINSEITDWKYVSVIPDHVIWERTHYILRISVTSIFLIMLIGGFIALYYSTRNYKPIKQMVELIRDNKSQDETISFDEYHYIKNSIFELLSEKDELTNAITSNNDTLKNAFLEKLLKNKLEKDVVIFDKLKDFNLIKLADNHLVALVCIEDCSNIFKEKSTDIKADTELALFIVRNIFEELIGEHFFIATIEVDDMLACVINCDNKADMDLLCTLCTKGKIIIEKEFHMFITISISSIHNSINQAPEAYKQASTAMDYKMIMGIRRVILHEQVSKYTNNRYRRYSPEVERQFINNVKVGDVEQSRKFLDSIINENISHNLISVLSAKSLMYDLSGTMIKAMDELPKDMQTQHDAVNNLLRCKTIYQLKDEIMRIITKVSAHVEENKKSHNVELKENIMKHIDQNYADINLCAQTIAETFNMNAAYILRFFREQAGESINDYLTRIRIGHAKALIQNTNMTMSEIAEKIGYNDSNSFIRAFKKREGITPGKYKKI